MAFIESNRYIVQVFVGALSAQYEALSVEASKQTSSEEIVSCIADKLNLNDSTGGAYELAEVVGDVVGGECKERRLGANESPVAVMLLWPNATSGQYYRFYLREKMTDALWMENFSVDPQLIKDYFQRFLYQPKDREYPDLCQLPDLNERTLLDNLRARFAAGYIYTYVGSILIAVNPFKFHPIYNPKYVKLYQNRRIGSSLPPHIFAVADAAYHCMLKERGNQCVVISGESGSGKTESTNFLLHHLTALSQKGSHGSGVEQTILSAGPVLEAFGNAKTAHNNNSSRFGKFIQVNYKENGMVYGAVVQKYLLEKSRICSQGRNERNYHVFYYLLAGASDQERQQLHLLSVDKYNYLSRNGTCVVPGADEKYEFSRLKQSMEMVGFTTDKQRRLFAVLSAVLLLGNVEFQPRKSYHHDEAVSVKNPETVALISELLRVKQETLLAALTAKRARASGETLVINYRLPEAIATRDAMAKCLYGALFDWIVMQVNHALLSKKDTLREHQGHSIGVLDIFGFEDFGPCNSFEQLCINYANEHLQYYFNQHVFKYEQEEYRREGIRWTDIGFSDNTGCLQLIEGKPGGLLCLLDDQCNFPGATNETLLQKFNSVHKDNTFYEKPQRREPAFIVRHYAGTVKYQVTNMREKNLDLMRQDIVGVLKNSSLAFVRELVGADPVAVFRWAIVRAFFRAYFAFHEAGRKHRIGRVDGATRLPRASIHTPNDTIISNAKYGSTGDYRTPYDETVRRIDGKAVKCSRWNASPAYRTTTGLSPATLTGRHLQEAKLERVFSNASDVMHRANQIVMKNKSFRPRERSKKGLKNLQSVKTLAGRTGVSGGTSGNKARKQPLTVAAQFQHSLHSLMDTLNQANPFFIRCIKSNGDKISNAFDDDTVQRQLRYTGMLETVRIRQAGYNVRLTYEEFIQLYRILLPKGLLSSQSDVRHFLATLNLNRDNYQLGGSKIFMRESEQTKLDFRLHQQIMASIITIQRWFRAVLERRRFLALRKAVLTIQRQCRLWTELRVEAVHKLQAWWRGVRERRAFSALRQIVLALQCYARGFLVRRNIKALKEARRKKPPVIQPPNRTCMEKDNEFTSRHPSIEQLCDTFNHELNLLLKEEQKREAEATRTLRATQSLPSPRADEVLISRESTLESRTTLQSYCKRKVTKTQNISELALKQADDSSAVTNDYVSNEDPELNLASANFAKCQPKKETDEREQKFTPLTKKITTEDVANELIWLRLDQNNLTGDIKRKVSPAERPFVKTIIAEQQKAAAVERTADPLDAIDAILREKEKEAPDKPTPQPYRRSLSATVLEAVPPIGLVSLPPVRRDPRIHDHNAASKKDSTQVRGSVRASASAEAVRVEEAAALRLARVVPEPPARAVRRPRRDRDDRNDRNDRNDDTRAMSEIHSRKDGLVPFKVPNKRKSSNQPSVDLRRRNSDPAAGKPGEIVSPNPRGRTNNNVEFIGSTANGIFEIAGHRFRKWTRFSKEDRCNYCHEAMDAFVTQCQRCLDCKQLYHTKCIQNKGVCDIPCPGAHPSGGRVNQKYRKAHRAIEPNKHPVQSKFSLTGTSEFTDRTDKIISDANELQLMQDFITKKIYKMESEKMKKQSEVDRLFKHALGEFKDNLVATYSVVNKQGSALKYKDLIANFLQVMETVCHREGGQAETFPVTMGVNAFRGFMDEFMNSRQDIDKTRVKRKKDKKRKAEDPIIFAGHNFVLSMINIPTECEICKTFFMWPLERSLICQNCKLASHKKCYTKVALACRWRGAGAAAVVGAARAGAAAGALAAPQRTFGLPLARLLLAAGAGRVPPVVDRLVTTIELYGLYTEGLYRKSGVSSKVKELKTLLDESPEDTIDHLEQYQVHVLTSVLKSFFRDMPEPLLTFDFYDDFIMAACLTDPQDRIATLFAILKKLPKPNYDLMERLIFHLARVALHEDSNRMGANPLAIVFAPCILRTNKIQPAQDSLHDIARQTLCVETILVERLKTVRTTLADIATLDTACHTAAHRLSSLRCSKAGAEAAGAVDAFGGGAADAFGGAAGDAFAARTPEPQTRAPEEEEALLVGHIQDIRKEKELLTSALPSLTRATSDDDLLSTDPDECGSLDDLTRARNAHAALHRTLSDDDPIMV